MVTCTSCGESVYADESYCEACGALLPAAAQAIASSPAWGVDHRDDPSRDLPGSSGSDHRDHRDRRSELVDGPVAAITDTGVVRQRNEDAVGIRWVDGHPRGFVLVVCDGVSISQEPHLVSRAAVESGLRVLSGAVSAGADLDSAMFEATAAAQRAVAAIPYDPTLEIGPGACTFVAAAIRGSRATFGSVGDSRAYWVDASGAHQIGRDDSLAAELVASGHYTAEQAMASAGAHALTKWLGIDSADPAPTITSVELPGPGLVILASDGLWNYAPDPGDLGRLVGRPGAESALDLVRRLAAYARDAGGADNITVAAGPHDLYAQEMG